MYTYELVKIIVCTRAKLCIKVQAKFWRTRRSMMQPHVMDRQTYAANSDGQTDICCKQ
jgi:hypothetical protein